MIRIQLTEQQIEALERLLKDAGETKLRHRAQIVLMAHRGRPRSQIAADTGTSQRSVQRWLNAYLDGGLERLRPRKAKGATPKLTEELAPTLRQWVIDGPAGQGLDRANWTYEELAEHLFKAKGIRVKKSAMQAYCRRHEIRPYRPTYRFLRGDPEKQAEAQGELAELKRGRRPVNWCC